MTFLWYDLETFGKNPRWDRVAQFAAVRTNEQFEAVEDPIVLYCRITPDYIPDPYACMITGITPQESLEKGLREYDFIKAIDKEFSRPGTCVVGYNSIRFDDEFIRNLYYRNFMDPYKREYADGNSRWDILDIVRATHDLRPEGIQWPLNEEGGPVFKLEKLSEANGIVHEHAHDALSDVYATIGMARLIAEKQPRLYNYFFEHRQKDELKRIINLDTREPLVHTSGMFTSPLGCTTLVAPLVVDPLIRNAIHCFDLRYDPSPLMELSVEEIRRRVFTPRKELEEEGIERIPLKDINIGKCPVVAPLATLDDEAARRLGIDREQCLEHSRILSSEPGLLQKVREVFNQDKSKYYSVEDDPDLQIYSGGFFRDDDKIRMKILHQTPPEELKTLTLNFYDPRIPEMLRRFIGRNFPSTLNEKEMAAWKSACAGRILFPKARGALDHGGFLKVLENLKYSTDVTPAQKLVVKELEKYEQILKDQVLKYAPSP